MLLQIKLDFYALLFKLIASLPYGFDDATIIIQV